MGKCISLGKSDKSYFIILLFLIIINIFTTSYDHYQKRDKLKNSRIMTVTMKHIGFSLCFIPELILKKSVRSKFQFNLKCLSLILSIAIIYLIHDFAYIFYDRYTIEKKILGLYGNFF